LFRLDVNASTVSLLPPNEDSITPIPRLLIVSFQLSG
jgi:hypothetical protein